MDFPVIRQYELNDHSIPISYLRPKRDSVLIVDLWSTDKSTWYGRGIVEIKSFKQFDQHDNDDQYSNNYSNFENDYYNNDQLEYQNEIVQLHLSYTPSHSKELKLISFMVPIEDYNSDPLRAHLLTTKMIQFQLIINYKLNQK